MLLYALEDDEGEEKGGGGEEGGLIGGPRSPFMGARRGGLVFGYLSFLGTIVYNRNLQSCILCIRHSMSVRCACVCMSLSLSLVKIELEIEM